MRDPVLWARLKEFDFDASSGSAPLTVKLARAEDWAPDFTRSVVEEYRKFLYLTQISNTEVTPSEAVDRAWHMHLTFTRSYWMDLCDKILGQPLHHDPCAGAEDMPRYERQFETTKSLYEEEFKEAPPEDVWGDVATHKPDPNAPAFVALGLAPLFLIGGLILLVFDKTNGAFLSFLISVFALVSGLVLLKTRPGVDGERTSGTVFGIGGCGGGGDSGGSDGGGAGCGGGGGG